MSTSDAPAFEPSSPTPVPDPVPESQPEPEGPEVAAETVSEAVAPEPVRSLSDDDAREGFFADVVSGEHKGRWGAVLQVLERDVDGFAKRVLFRTRDEDNLLLDVAHKDLRPSKRLGGR